MSPVIEPTDQMLRDACARMAARFHWADDFETVMRDRVRSRLVRIEAKHPPATGVPAARAMRGPACRPLQAPKGGLPLFDRKRAASGERDDD